MFLVVEDDELSMSLMCRMLKAVTKQIPHVAYSGTEALELLSSNVYDLVITDLRMKPVTGSDVCKEIKNNPNSARTVVFAVSAELEFGDDIYEMELFDAAFGKPVTISLVKDMLSVYREKRAFLDSQLD